MGTAARRVARDKFSLSLTIQRTIELYQLILEAQVRDVAPARPY
jgi:hypothetical protein